MQNMGYKLLIMDLDDTLAQNLGMPPKQFLPSQRLRKKIQQAISLIDVSLCTGRDQKIALEVVNVLHLQSPQIIEGGARIITKDGTTLWSKYLLESDAQTILQSVRESRKTFSLIIDGQEIEQMPSVNQNKVSAILIYNLSKIEESEFRDKLKFCSDASIATNTDRAGYTMYITHKEGTKRHGIQKLMKFLKIKKEEAIGIGDGNNDCPLFESCGFKVAMGNATQKLKHLADYITSPVDEDGVAEVIEKFILHT